MNAGTHLNHDMGTYSYPSYEEQRRARAARAPRQEPRRARVPRLPMTVDRERPWLLRTPNPGEESVAVVILPWTPACAVVVNVGSMERQRLDAFELGSRVARSW